MSDNPNFLKSSDAQNNGERLKSKIDNNSSDYGNNLATALSINDIVAETKLNEQKQHARYWIKKYGRGENCIKALCNDNNLSYNAKYNIISKLNLDLNVETAEFLIDNGFVYYIVENIKKIKLNNKKINSNAWNSVFNEYIINFPSCLANANLLDLFDGVSKDNILKIFHLGLKYIDKTREMVKYINKHPELNITFSDLFDNAGGKYCPSYLYKELFDFDLFSKKEFLDFIEFIEKQRDKDSSLLPNLHKTISLFIKKHPELDIKFDEINQIFNIKSSYRESDCYKIYYKELGIKDFKNRIIETINESYDEGLQGYLKCNDNDERKLLKKELLRREVNGKVSKDNLKAFYLTLNVLERKILEKKFKGIELI